MEFVDNILEDLKTLGIDYDGRLWRSCVNPLLSPCTACSSHLQCAPTRRTTSTSCLSSVTRSSAPDGRTLSCPALALALALALAASLMPSLPLPLPLAISAY